MVCRGFTLPAGRCRLQAQKVPVVEKHLANGMRLLLVERHDEPPSRAAGWRTSGSSNERLGMTGIAHLFEHMMFKGTPTIGTKNYQKDLEIIAAQERIRDEMRQEERKMRVEYRHGEIDDLLKPENKTAALSRAGEGVQPAHRRAARHPGQERVRPDLQRGGRVGHERLHVRGHDRLFRQRARQQARAVDVDGVGAHPAPGLPRVLCRARRGLRGAAHADGFDAAGQVPGGVQRDVLGILALRLADRGLALGHPGHLQGAGRRVLLDLLFAAEHHAHPRGRLRAGQGRGAGARSTSSASRAARRLRRTS